MTPAAIKASRVLCDCAAMPWPHDHGFVLTDLGRRAVAMAWLFRDTAAADYDRLITNGFYGSDPS